MNTGSSDVLTIDFERVGYTRRGDLFMHVNIRSRDDAVAFMFARLSNNDGFCFATLNLDHVVKLRENGEFVRAYAHHDAVCADGFPIVWLAKMSGVEIDRTAGSDLIRPAIRVATNLNRSISIVGTTADTIDAAEAVLKREFADLRISLKSSPRLGFDPRSEEAADIVRAIVASECSLCLVALGAPKQEMFADFARGIAPHVGFLSIGAGIDFISGKRTRAPVWMQDINLEWLWRLLSDPGRLSGRYLKCMQILPSLLMSAAAGRDIRVRLRQPYRATDGRRDGLT